MAAAAPHSQVERGPGPQLTPAPQSWPAVGTLSQARLPVLPRSPGWQRCGPQESCLPPCPPEMGSPSEPHLRGAMLQCPTVFAPSPSVDPQCESRGSARQEPTAWPCPGFPHPHPHPGAICDSGCALCALWHSHNFFGNHTTQGKECLGVEGRRAALWDPAPPSPRLF